MHIVANYEIKTDCSVVQDDLVLKIKHPRDLYRARIQNIKRPDYTSPFLLSLHLYFDAPTLDDAQDIAEEYLADCMNMLALTSGSSYQRHRIRQIVDATPEIAGMRTLFMWSDSIDHEDPQPFLSTDSVRTIERLLEFDAPPAIRRAMRWYRLGINATIPDDQFTYFWFALEIIAEFQKSSEKVPDRCPRCKSPLYCETCKTNPEHRPYPKQAIQALMHAADKECDDTTIERLDKTRNSLMHGSTLSEIEQLLPEPHEHIVDILGRLVWRALILQFPHEMFDGPIGVGLPTTYIYQKLRGIAHMQTVVPTHSDGDLDLSFTGMKIELVPPGPPQSALPTVISMSDEQYERLGQLSYTKGDHQEMLKRIYQRVEKDGDRVHALVLSTDMVTIEDVVKRGDNGDWQELFREIKEESQK